MMNCVWIFVLTNVLLFSCNRKGSDQIIHERYKNLAHNSSADSYPSNEQVIEVSDEFCRCVLATDSVAKLIRNITDFETNYADQLLEQLEYIQNNCRSIIKPLDQQTTQEQQLYKEKVKKCRQDSTYATIDLFY